MANGIKKKLATGMAATALAIGMVASAAVPAQAATWYTIHVSADGAAACGAKKALKIQQLRQAGATDISSTDCFRAWNGQSVAQITYYA